jgi:hypothetical protein
VNPQAMRPIRSAENQEGMSMEETRSHLHVAGQFVGSALVIGASYGPQTTVLRLQTFAGESIEYSVGGIPSPAGAAEFRSYNLRPISVMIQQGGEQCSVIGLATDGPRRANVTLDIALALHQSGVHMVVDGGLRTGVPCSSHRTPFECS